MHLVFISRAAALASLLLMICREWVRQRFDKDKVVLLGHSWGLIWFEQSAHNPPFEEPVKFNQVLIEEVLPLSHQ